MAYVLGRRKPNLTFPTLTGNIITFNSQYAGLPLKSCKVDIPVTQEGTGDPSPENMRNFVGVSSLDFSATGKNLLRINRSTSTDTGVTFTVNEDFSITTSGEYQGQNAIFSVSLLVTLRAGTYIFTGCPSGGSYSDYVLRLEDSSNVRIALDTGNGTTFTITEDQPVYCRIYIYSQNGVGKTFYPMVRLVDSNSNYEPFGNNKLFTFGQTIYAGELDVLTGLLTATHHYLHITTVNVMNSQRANVDVGGNRTVAVQLEQNELMCNILKPETFSSALDNHIHFSNVQTLQLYMAEEIGTTVAEWETWLSDHPLYVCYKLETPEVINLGGMNIATLQGENNLFASTGETTAEYIKIGG